MLRVSSIEQLSPVPSSRLESQSAASATHGYITPDDPFFMPNHAMRRLVADHQERFTRLRVGSQAATQLPTLKQKLWCGL